MTSRRPAVFLDRDGTLNVDCCYLTRPEQMQLLPGVGEAIRLLKAADFACVVVTNQSAVGRGMMSETDLELIHEEMKRQLAELGVQVDGIYAATAVADHPDRKPAPGMLLRAACDLNLHLAESWMIGDSLRDILAGQNAGCRSCILVGGAQPVDPAQLALAKPYHAAQDLLAAAQLLLTKKEAPR